MKVNSMPFDSHIDSLMNFAPVMVILVVLGTLAQLWTGRITAKTCIAINIMIWALFLGAYMLSIIEDIVIKYDDSFTDEEDQKLTNLSYVIMLVSMLTFGIGGLILHSDNKKNTNDLPK